jgi:hypothetical protein
VAGSFAKLSRFPRNRLIEVDMVRGRVSELDLLRAYGDPVSDSTADLTPTCYWDLEWPCGLVVDLRFDQLEEELKVRLDETDIDHALRHLELRMTDMWRIDETPGLLGELAPRADLTWEVWRETGPDRRERIADGLTERDARCQADELSSLGSDSRFFVNHLRGA